MSGVSYDANPDQFEANNNYHKALWGFKSSLGYYLGYTYEIAKSGLVRKAREHGAPTAAATQSWTRDLIPRYTGPMNDGRCIHICIDGNFDIQKPAPGQIYALRDLLKKVCKQFNIPKGNIYFHRDFAQKTCPGMNIDRQFIRNLID